MELPRRISIFAAFASLTIAPSISHAFTIAPYAIVYGAYYEVGGIGACPFDRDPPVSSCGINFPATRTGRPVVLTHISCRFDVQDYDPASAGVPDQPITDPKVERIFVGLTGQPPSEAQQALTFKGLGTSQDGTDYYSVNVEVEFLIGGSQWPHLTMELTESARSTFSSCVLTGSII